jgi:hypothetical protein
MSPPVGEVETGAEVSKRTSRRRKTAHLKDVPETKELRDRLKAQCAEISSRLDKSRPLSKDDGGDFAGLLGGLEGDFRMGDGGMYGPGEQVAAIRRRGGCSCYPIRSTPRVSADYDEFGLDCKMRCAASPISGQPQKTWVTRCWSKKMHPENHR